MDANTTTSGSFVSVLEGNTVTISCVSRGAPTPSVTWEFNGEVPLFIPSNVVEETRAVVVRDSNHVLLPDITPGSTTSYLMVVNAQYPDHDGVYTCIGSNDNEMRNSSTVSITVQVQGMYIFTQILIKLIYIIALSLYIRVWRHWPCLSGMDGIIIMHCSCSTKGLDCTVLYL